MKNVKKILIDMDGVIADFVRGCCEAHDRPNPFKGKYRGYNIEEAWGISTEEFWEPMKNPSFWENLKRFSWSDSIVTKAFSLVGPENVSICTAPSTIGYTAAVEGKLRWLDSHYPDIKKIFTKHKYFCAEPNTALVDDTESKIEAFNEYGGVGILFPQPWNQLGIHVDIESVLGKMEEFVKS